MTDHWQVIEDALADHIEHVRKTAEFAYSRQQRRADEAKLSELTAALAFVREQQLAERTPPTPSVPLPPYHIREVATMASNQVWKPVGAVPIESQHLTTYGEVVYEMVFAEENRLLVTNGPNQHDSNALAVATLPDNIRLCQLVDAPAAVTIPSEVREAIRRLTAYGIPVGCTNADWIRWRETVTKWLDAQPADDA